jgi:hypothetical protein
MSITCNETREKIASFADANTPPHASHASRVRLRCGAAVATNVRSSFGKTTETPASTSASRSFTSTVPEHLLRQAVGTVREKVGKRYGWRSSPEKKAVALGLLRRAYAHGGFINHDEKALDEA